jgi:hypothetical protein
MPVQARKLKSRKAPWSFTLRKGLLNFSTIPLNSPLGFSSEALFSILHPKKEVLPYVFRQFGFFFSEQEFHDDPSQGPDTQMTEQACRGKFDHTLELYLETFEPENVRNA